MPLWFAKVLHRSRAEAERAAAARSAAAVACKRHAVLFETVEECWFATPGHSSRTVHGELMRSGRCLGCRRAAEGFDVTALCVNTHCNQRFAQRPHHWLGSAQIHVEFGQVANIKRCHDLLSGWTTPHSGPCHVWTRHDGRVGKRVACLLQRAQPRLSDEFLR